MQKTVASAKAVVRTLQEAGFIAYFAGGFVRDDLMGHPSDDIDIATNASVKEVQRLFPKTIEVGVAFGIVIVAYEGSHFEVATFRKDRGYVDGRRPSGIDPASPQEDAQRRDFTINGLFYDPIVGKIYDYVGGEADIKRGIIRAIGNPDERFFEDRLRMMRAVRYATRFGFPIEEKTLKAIRAHAKDLLPSVAMERIWQEFKKMSHFAHFDTGLVILHELGLLPIIFPELQSLSLKELKRRIRFIPTFPKGAPTFAELLELFPKIDLDTINTLAEYLKLSNREKAFAKFYHRATTLLNMPAEWLTKLEKVEWAQFYADPQSDISLQMIAIKKKNPQSFLSEHSTRSASLKPHVDRIKNKHPYLRAKQLIEAGIEPGEKLGDLLEEGMRIAVNEDITDPVALIERLRQTSLW